MNDAGVVSKGSLYRDADRAWIGGVCAGLAGHLGFNLKLTRLLAIVALLSAGPIAVVAYIAAVFLLPSRSDPGFEKVSRRKRRRRCRERHQEPERHGPSASSIIDSRCEELDQRLAELERHVTSKRFQIEQELSRL